MCMCMCQGGCTLFLCQPLLWPPLYKWCCNLATEIGGGFVLVPETTHTYSVAYGVALLYGEASLEAGHAATNGGLQVSS